MRSRALGYGLAVLGVAVTLGAKLFLGSLVGRDAPFLLFFAPVVVSAWYGGVGPGLLATALAALLSDYFFIAPVRSIFVGEPDAVLRIAAFAVEGTFVTIVGASLRRARRRAEANMREARALEAERTRLLGVEQTARAHAAFVAEASRMLASSLDVETGLRNIADLAVAQFADLAVAELVADDGTTIRVSAASRGPAGGDRIVTPVRFSGTTGDDGLAALVAAGAPALHADVPEPVRRTLEAAAPDSARARGLVIDSAIVVPLVVEERTLGALAFASHRPRRPLGNVELRVAEDVARRIALAVDRARMSRETQEAHRRFQDLVQGLQEIVWEIDPQTLQFTFVSQYAEEMLGYAAERWRAPDFLATVVHPDDRSRVLAQRERARGEWLGHDIEYRALAADGRVVWVRDIGRVVRDAGGVVRRFSGVMVDATARKLGEEALSQVASIVEASGDAILGTTLDGTIVSWNSGAERLYGYGAREVLGRSVALLLPLDRPDEVGRLSERLKRGEHVADFETVRVARDGRLLDVSLTLSPVRDASGALVAVSAIGRDVSERKRTERRLAAQYAVGRALAEAGSLADAAPRVLQAIGEGLGWTVGALWIVDADAGVLRCADIWDAAFPATPTSHAVVRQATFAPGAGVVGRAWLARAPVWVADVLEEPEAKRGLAGCRENLRGAFAFPVRGKAGVLGVVEFVSHGIRPPDADLVMMVGAIGHQIGQFIERRKAELAVRESEALKGAIVETSIDGIITIDHEGTVVEFNPAAERIFGYARHEAVGRELAALIIPPAERARYRDDFARSVATGETHGLEQHTEMCAMRADGSELTVEMAIIQIPLPFPRPPVFTGYVRDISERKRAEATERNAEALRSVARLANAAGHEINNPLTVIITSLEMLGKDLESGYPVSPSKVKPILAAAERIRDVIAHMRRVTRLELVNREPHLPEMLDLRESSPARHRIERDEP